MIAGLFPCGADKPATHLHLQFRRLADAVTQIDFEQTSEQVAVHCLAQGHMTGNGLTACHRIIRPVTFHYATVFLTIKTPSLTIC